MATSATPPPTLPPAPARPALAFGRYVLDPQRAEPRRDGDVVALRPKAFDLLLTLAAHPGQVLGQDELLAAVWPGVVVGEDSLAQCVHELRAALGEDGPAFVRTVPRRGYRFDAEVHAVAVESFELERARLGPALDDVVQQIARQPNVEMYRAEGSRAAALTPEQVQADDLAMQGWGVHFRGTAVQISPGLGPTPPLLAAASECS